MTPSETLHICYSSVFNHLGKARHEFPETRLMAHVNFCVKLSKHGENNPYLK